MFESGYIFIDWCFSALRGVGSFKLARDGLDRLENHASILEITSELYSLYFCPGRNIIIELHRGGWANRRIQCNDCRRTILTNGCSFRADDICGLNFPSINIYHKHTEPDA